MKVYRIFFFQFILLVSSTVNSADLLEVYKIAVNSDPALKQAQQQVSIANEGQKQAYGAFLPSLSLTANTYDYHTHSITGATSNYNKNGYAVTLGQTLFDNENYVNHNIAKLGVSSAQASLLVEEQDLIYRVVNAYLDILLTKDNLQFTKAEQKAIERQLDQAKRQFEVGSLDVTAVLNAQAGFDSSVANVLKAKSDHQIAKEKLKDIAGQYFAEIVPVVAEFELTLPKEPKEIKNNPQILVKKIQVEKAVEQVELSRSGHYPSLNLAAGYKYDKSHSSSSGTSRNEYVGLEFSVPLYSGGVTSSKVTSAKHSHNVALEQMEELKRVTERQVKSSHLSLISEVSRVKAFKQAVVSYDSALKATEAGFEAGTRTVVDLLNVQRDQYSAKIKYAESRYNYIRHSIALKQAVGALSLEDIKLINSWLNN